MELIRFDVTENGIEAYDSSHMPGAGWTCSCKVRNILRRGGRYCLVHSGKENYDTFPGGSMEPGEAPADAVLRKTREEVGCQVSGLRMIGEVREFREKSRVLQTTYYFISDFESPGNPQMTQEELDLDTMVKWVGEAECGELLDSQTSPLYFRRFSGMRDQAFFQRYRESGFKPQEA